MKKFNAKLAISAFLAVVMASASAVSISAGDYGEGKFADSNSTASSGSLTGVTNAVPYTGALPTSTGSSGGGSSTPASSTSTGAGTGTTTPVADDTSDDAVSTGVLTDAAIEAIIASADGNELLIPVAEDSKGKLVIQEEVIAAIKESGITVTLEVTSDDGFTYFVTIDPDTITKVTAIDVAMNFTVGTEEGDEVSGVEIPAGSIVIEPNQKGDFGMELTVTLPADVLGDINAEDANLFYISSNGKVTEMSDSISANADDSVSITISHASAYVITDADLNGDVGGDDDSWGKIDEDDDDDTIVVSGETDANPHTGVTLAFGALAASAAAVAITAKKRK
jgi:hypothetical protein